MFVLNVIPLSLYETYTYFENCNCRSFISFIFATIVLHTLFAYCQHNDFCKPCGNRQRKK